MLDENLSDRIVSQIEDLFPGSAHVKAVGLREADDAVVWEWAKQNGFTIVSKDTDFHQRAIVFGHPPKFIWLRVGNSETRLITDLLKLSHHVIRKRSPRIGLDIRCATPAGFETGNRRLRKKPRPQIPDL
jgi:predicted nuclease of predicted toxin-antitoxin system